MRFQVFVLTAAVLLQIGQASIFEVDMWPEEGRPVFQAVGQPLRLRAAPSSSSQVVATVPVQAGRRLAFDQTLYRTTRAGSFTALKASVIAGRDLGDITRLAKADYYSAKFPPASVSVKSAETIEYLQYRAEGTCFVRVGLHVINAAPCPNQQPNEFRTQLEPTTEWWIHVTVSQRAVGWVLVSATTVKEIDREG
jgi:hypothetical protein